MTILNREHIDSLNYEDSKRALKQAGKDHRLTASWAELTKEERANTDDVCNMLLWLEDRIKQFEDSRVGSMDPTATEVLVQQPKEKSQVRYNARQFKINDRIYKDVHEASFKTGIKVNTLRTYVSRKPDIYSYVE